MNGRSRVQSHRCAGRAAFLLALGIASPARAERAPEPLWQHVNLTLEVRATTADCPEQPRVATWVNDLVGREFVVPEAEVELAIGVDIAPNDELLVELVALETTSAGAPLRTELRRFQRASSCSELLRAAALTISLFAKTPDGDAAPSAATPPPVIVEDSAPSGASELPAVASPVVPSPVVPSPQVSPLPPRAVSVPSPLAPSAPPSPPVGDATAALPQPRSTQQVPADPPSAVSDSPRPAPNGSSFVSEVDTTESQAVPGLTFGAYALGALGANPGAGVGASGHVGLHWPEWQLLLRGGYLASTGQRLTPSELGTIYGPTAEVALAACGLLTGPVSTPTETRLRVCGVGGPLWVYARGRGFDQDRRATATTVAVGASLDLLVLLTAHWAFGVKVDALVPLKPVDYRLEGDPVPSWTMWPVAPRIGLGIEWR